MNRLEPVKAWAFENASGICAFECPFEARSCADKNSEMGVRGKLIPALITDARCFDQYQLSKREDGRIGLLKLDENGEPCAFDSIGKGDNYDLFVEFLEAVMPIPTPTPQPPEQE